MFKKKFSDLASFVESTDYSIGIFSIGDLVKHKKRQMQGVVIDAKRGNPSKIKVWNTNGSFGRSQNANNFVKLKTRGTFKIEPTVDSDRKPTFSVKIEDDAMDAFIYALENMKEEKFNPTFRLRNMKT